MNVLVTPAQMRAAEAAAVAAGADYPGLMRVAAERIADWLDLHIENSRSGAQRHAIGLVGPGNNGGDTLVALTRLERRGWRCGAVLTRRESFKGLPAESDELERIALVGADALAEADVVLDGVFGLAGRASVPEDVADLFELALTCRVEQGTALIAIDVPSGIDALTGAASPAAFRADLTLCLGLPKWGLVREPAASCAGELVVLDIGLTAPDGVDAVRLIDERSVRRALPRRDASAHKHSTGTTLIVGGAEMYYGAPRLAAEAAMRVGAGLVALAAPASIVPVIAGQLPEAVMAPLDESRNAAATSILRWIEERGDSVRSVVVGPGLGRAAVVEAMLDELFSTGDAWLRHDSPWLVIDADGLNWLAGRDIATIKLRGGAAMLTPHAGELARLLDSSRDVVLDDPVGAARVAALRYEQIVVLKSGYTVIASPDGGVWLSPRATPELATAGTGDVLAGIIGGLLAQGLEPLDAAIAGVFIGGRAGRMARAERGVHGIIARDLIEQLPFAIRSLTEPRGLRLSVAER